MVEPPSLPYARDEASTSHHNHTFGYPSYTDTFETEEEEVEGSVEDEGNAAPQYWAAKRHKSGKGKAKSEEEHSKSLLSSDEWAQWRRGRHVDRNQWHGDCARD